MSEPQIPGPLAPREPLVTVGSISAIVVAILATVVSFGLPLDNDQQAAILGLAAVIAPFLVVALGRPKVWSPASVRAAVLAAQNDKRRGAPMTAADREALRSSEARRDGTAEL